MVTSPVVSSRVGKRWVLATVAAVTICGVALRAAGLSTELWFDEIHSIRCVRSLHSAWQVLWSIHSDNKHHLIWLWIWLTGSHRADWVYRIPSLAAGILLLPILFYRLRREFGLPAALFGLMFAAFCYPLIFYCSEARGYSLATLLAVCAYGHAPDVHRKDSVAGAVLFFGAVVSGFLAHLTFVYIYAGLLAWMLVDAVQKPRWMLLAYHLPILCVLSLIYIFDVSKMLYGGGPPTTSLQVLRWTISMTFGTSVDGALAWFAGLALLAVTGLGLVITARKFGPGRFVFFLTAIILAPVVLTATRRNPYLATRYYLVCLPFVIMLGSISLAGVSGSLPGKIVTGVILAAVVINGVFSTMQLQQLGRGHVRECLMHMSIATPSDPISYNSERPVMDVESVDYYAAAIPAARRFIIAGDKPAEWWLLDLDTPLAVGPPTIRRRGVEYQLDSVYTSDSISGLTWDLYHRKPKQQ